jgi:hypothetical protein
MRGLPRISFGGTLSPHARHDMRGVTIRIINTMTYAVCLMAN